MTIASKVDVTRQFYTVDDLAALLRADFADRGTLATVDVDEWGPEKMRGEPIVVICYDTGEFTEPAGHYQPGVMLDTVSDQGTPTQARALLDDVQGYVLRIHAASKDQAETKAEGGRRATDQLMRQTLRAVRRALAAPFRKAGTIEWPGKSDPDVLASASWSYGSLCRVRFPLASPIADDAYAYGTVTFLGTDAEISVDGGASFVASESYDQQVPPP